jgi:hypothetical protein
MEDREIILSILFLVGFILLLRFALHRWIRYDDRQLADPPFFVV